MQLLAMDEQPVINGKPVEVWQVSEAQGQSIKPDVQAKLKELYPEDEATGFSEGELRGAFVVTHQPSSE